jgi:hypothetical protein
MRGVQEEHIIRKFSETFILFSANDKIKTVIQELLRT